MVRRQVRLGLIVTIGAFVAWMVLQFLGGQLGLPARFVFLLDLACIAALVFALLVLFKAWRASQNDGV
ncbi:DUF5337 domain-containing protein [Halovulum dunhuangense]|uniref:DUF5337 domain-containing protein n=2 Tax=Halovulum dunhuangense TaxID=1505036 RepID=A0A849L5Z9_9RHOB|nr:DUF5337 family protein [Halovulum dunhuangense]NNU81835.1 DUF5337 domain-containing protein [Halovulum dunhuangense]